MSLSNAIRSIAFAESDTLSGAVALMAKHRNDLTAALRAAELKPMPVASAGAAVERALLKIEPPAEPARGVDKVA